MKIFTYGLLIAGFGVAGFVAAVWVASSSAGGSQEPSLPRMAERTTVEVVEDCAYGRCPCMTAHIRQTSAPAGWSSIQQSKSPINRCDTPPQGYHAEKFGRDKCVICPDGMRYSAFLMDSAQIRRRANLAENQCVSIQRSCVDDAR